MARRTSNGPLLDRRARNRALLARQHLLERTRMPVPGMVEHLVGMQAQSPPAPYVGLQARLEDFRPDQLADLLLDRSMVRGSLMRCTLHLTTASDYLELCPLVQIVLERGFHTGSPFARQLTGVDVGELLDAGRALVDEQPRTRAELRELLAPRWPGRDQDSLAYALSYLLPLVQVPPRGIWGKAGQARLTTVEAWTGQPLGSKLTLDDLVLRYLAAFGPASVADIQTWSWLTRLREVVERLRPGLEVFTDEAGRELFDLPGAPRPDPGTPAPPRFLPEYDNLLLSHAERDHVIAREHREPVFTKGALLVDGFARGSWTFGKGRASITVQLFAPLSPAETDAVMAEGDRLLDFAAPGADGRVVLNPP
jgi:hypothetical protein